MNEKVSMLKEKAKELRKTALTMIFEAQSGHPGGSLSSADIVTALYFSEMHVDSKNPQWPDRDRFVLSKGFSRRKYCTLCVRKDPCFRATPACSSAPA